MPRKPALTLVELLASLVIASILAVAALSISTALAKSTLAIRREERGPRALEASLASLLKADLVHAHHWQPVEGGFALQTTARLNHPTPTLEHIPAIISYRVVVLEDRAYLVRTQETPPEPPTSELVAVGATDIVLKPEADVRPNRFGWKALDGSCTVSLTFENPSATEIQVPFLRERIQ